jgi:hypothetical protein
MNKRLLLTLIVIILGICNLFAQTVQITKSGEKYRTNNCRYLSKSSFSIDLLDAKARGYSSCSVCRPSSEVESINSGSSKLEPLKTQSQTKTQTQIVQ